VKRTVSVMERLNCTIRPEARKMAIEIAKAKHEGNISEAIEEMIRDKHKKLKKEKVKR